MDVQGLDKVEISIFDTIRIKDSAPFFQGLRGVVSYIGKEGVSVVLVDLDLDDYVTLRWSEFDVVERYE